MALNLSELNQQVGQMGQALASRAATQEDRVALALRRLQEHSGRLDMLREKVECTRSRRGQKELGWVGAFPPEDPYAAPLAQAFDLPECPPAATLIANDGSQILPDRHAILPYFMINVGSIVLCHGSGQAPLCEVTPELHYLDDDVYIEGELIPAAAVQARRDLLAMKVLARLSEQHDGAPPVLSVVDGPLLLWGYQESLPGAQRRKEENIRTYLDALTRLERAGALAAGYIDRPGNRGVVNLLFLAALEDVTAETLRGFDMGGVRDQDIFERCLQPGQRSALFVTQSHINKTYAEREHEIWFFYLNVAPRIAPRIAPPSGAPRDDGAGEQHAAFPVLARVEVPAWVARDRAALDRVHALLYAQCQMAGALHYPYVLTRADELARIDPGDKHEVERLIQSVLMQRGLRAVPSQKELSKQHTRSRGTRRR